MLIDCAPLAVAPLPIAIASLWLAVARVPMLTVLLATSAALSVAPLGPLVYAPEPAAVPMATLLLPVTNVPAPSPSPTLLAPLT
ncbi:hypothetical protein BBS_6 [Burkholderia pseudomallei NAU20B-16]|nr:hypothetical protein BBS_6 [Burkholderia pseudomallei NAU20B-16]